MVTGVQFWVTDYLTLSVDEGGLGQPLGTVVICFSLCSLTGPTAGVFMGGAIVDKMGGYQDRDGTGEHRGSSPPNTPTGRGGGLTDGLLPSRNNARKNTCINAISRTHEHTRC